MSRVYQILICLAFSNATIGESTAQDTCQVFCDSLEASIFIDVSAGCDVSFSAAVDTIWLEQIDSLGFFEWHLDGDSIGNVSQQTLSAAVIQEHSLLELYVGFADSLIACTCIDSINLELFEEEYEWPCECQPEGPPEADFEIIGAGDCGDIPILFSNQSVGFGLDFSWDFGNNGEYGSSEFSSPEVPIIIDGGGVENVPITLTVTDANGCEDSQTQTIQVLQIPNPGLQGITALCISDATWPNYPITFVPLPFGFSGIDSISIDWGNDTDTTFSPSEPFFDVLSPPYDEFGDYEIVISTIGNNGCVSTFSDDLFVGNNPQIGTANPGNTDGLCSPYELDFPVSNFEANAIGTMYTVDFGDGSPVEVYDHPPPQSVQHEYSLSSCGETTPLGSYNAFLFEIEASNACGVSNAAIDPIRVHQAPNPVINGPNPVCVDEVNTYFTTGNGVEVDDCPDPECCTYNTGFWTISPLQGQASSTPTSAQQTNVTEILFPEPGLYGISFYEPHLYCQDGFTSTEVCVYPELDPEFTFSTDGTCYPMEVQLSDITDALLCGVPDVEWTIQGGGFSWLNGSTASDPNPTVVLTEAGTYTVTLSHSIPGSKVLQCGVYQESVQIEVFGPPTVTVSGDVFLCESESAVVSILDVEENGSDVESVLWELDGNIYAEAGYTQAFDFNEYGVFEISVTVGNQCGSDTEVVLAEIQPNPQIVVNSTPANGVCAGSMVEFTAVGADEMTWTLEDVEQSGSSFAFVAGVSVAGTVEGSTTYEYVTCSSIVPFSIEVFDLPIAVLDVPEILCLGDELIGEVLVVSGQPEYVVEWEVGNDLGFLDTGVGGSYQVLPNTPASYTMDASVFDANGCGSETQIDFEVLPLPTVDAGDDLTFCNQDFSFELEEAEPVGGEWFGPGIVDGDGLFNPDGLSEGDYNIFYVFTDDFGCSNGDSVSVEIADPVAIDAGPDLTFCQSDSVHEFSDYFPEIDVFWLGQGLSEEQDGVDLALLAPGDHTFTMTFGSASCLVEDDLIVSVLPRPEVNAIGQTQVCLFDSSNIEIEISGGTPPYLIEWMSDVTLLNEEGSLISYYGASVGTEQLELFVTDVFGCATYYAFNVETLALPDVEAGANIEVCLQASPVSIDGYFPALDGNGTGQFSGLGNASDAVTIEGLFFPDIVGLGEFEVEYSYQLDSTGCVNSDTVQVTVVPDVVLSLQPMDSSYCQFASPVTPLEVAVEGGTGTYSYQWYESTTAGTSGGALIPGATFSTYVPLVDVVGTVYYYCIITSSGANCEVVSDYAAIVTNEAPEFTMTLVDQEVCLDGALDSYTVTYTNGTGVPSYQWYSNSINSTLGGTLLTGETSSTYQPLSDATGATWYYCEVSFSFGGCDLITSTPVLVNVVADPVISLEPLATDTLCVGGSPYLPLEVAYEEGTGTPTYQWFLGNGTAIGGATASTYLPPSYDTPGTYTYYAEVTLSGSGCDVAQSEEAEVVVVADPVVTLQPSDTSYCQFAAPVIPLEVAVDGGTGTYSYQWYESSTAGTSGGALIPGATFSTYVPLVDVVGTVYYYCIITSSGANCEVVSDYAAIVTNEAPEFTMTLVDQEVCLDGALDSYTVTYTNGTGVPSYQWYSNTVNSTLGGTLLTGETSSTYQPLSNATGATWYYCEVSFSFGGCEMIASPPVLVSVFTDPLIAADPLATDTICVGGSLYLPLEVQYAEGAGSPLYQWYLVDGTPIDGANSSTYLPPSFDTPGTYTYYAEVSVTGSGCAAIQSAEAEVIVVDDPVVTLQPMDSSYCQFASPVTPLEVAVEGGTGTYSYQWYESTTAGTSGGALIPGATFSTYVPLVDVVGTVYYYCIITSSGANCEVVSDYAAIVTNEAPEFTMTLVDQEVCLDGALDSYTVTYTNGTGVPSYQWYSNSINSTLGGTLLTGETSSTYQPLSDATGATWYYCEVSFSFGGCDLITSTPVLVNVVADPVISLEPLATDTLCVGGSPYLPLEVAYEEGTGTPTYQWFLGNGTAIGGATASTYLPPSYDTPGTYTYYAEVTLSGSGCDVAQSEEAEVVVVADPVVTLQPSDTSYCQFAAPVIPLEVAVDGGTGTYSYQWYESSTAGTSGGALIPGATFSTYVPLVDVVGTVYYYCIITSSGANCEVVSDYAAIVTNEAPEFTMTLVDQEVCLDGALDSYTVTYTNGTGVPSYQWYSNTVNSTLGGTLLTGETSSTYQPLSDATGATWYYCEVSFSFGGCDLITSTPVLVNVVADPVISLEPLATDTLCVGGSPYLPLEVAYEEGTGTPTYQWFLGNGTAIGGATASTYLPPSYDTPGTYTYYAEVTLSGSGCDVAQSEEAEVVVVADPVVTLQPSDTSYCQFAAPVIPLEVAVDGGTGTYSYQWYESSTAGTSGGALIPGATFSTYVPLVDVVGTVYYYCIITSSGANCEVVSDYAAIVTNEAPEFTTQPLAQTLCSGEAPNLLEVAFQYGTGIPSYQWYENTVSNYAGTPIPGATNPSYQPLGAAPGSLYYYCVISFDGGGCDQITSVIAGIHVNNIVIGSIVADQAICSGQAPEALLQNTLTTGGGTLFYQWLEGVDGMSDLNEIPGAITDGYAPPALFDTTYYLLEVSSVLNTVACIDTTNAVEVIVYPLPEISIGPADVYCVNDGIQELTEFSPIGGVWEGPGVTDAAAGLFEVDGPQTGVGEWGLFFWYEDLVTGCRDTLDHEVTVNPMPTAAFEVPELACNNFPIAIDQNSVDAALATWDFGNGDASGDILPVYTYPDPGVFTIELIVENGFGCLDTSFAETEITYLPQADFSISDNEGCAPFVVEFINLSDAPFSTHEWMLGDSLFEGVTPDPTLFAQGPELELYDVVLSVSNVCGTTSESQTVSVIPVPQMSFLLLEDTACSPFTPDILNTSVGLPDQIDWDFGNGQTESGTITDFPTYFVDPDSSATTFFITVVGTNECGTDSYTAPIVIQPNTIQAFFAVDQDEGCAPLAVSATDLSFETTESIFDFGNGQVSYDQESSTVYEDPGTYVITQYVTNGCSLDTTYYEIEVWPQPDYTLSSDQPNYCEGETVSLTLASDEPTSVVWQFGQGDSDTGLNVSTVYANDGTYFVNAEVTSGINGCVANGTLPVTIFPTPELAIDPGLEGGCSPLNVSFENNSTDADFWNWDFGDGEESGATAPNHTFVNPDQEPVDYTITVYASNLEGCEATTQLDLTILPAPEAGIGGIEDQYCGVPASVVPENMSQYAIDYQWEVDGQLVSTAFEPDLTFESSGVFALELTAFNEYDCPATAIEFVVVHVNPIPALNLSPLDGCPPLDVYLQDASVGAVSELTITYEDEVVYQGPPTTNYYLFEWSGSYTLGLEVTSGDGCTVNEPNLEVITVHSEPFALFEMVPYDAGAGPDIPSSLNTQWTFLNLSNDNSLNYWQFGDGAVSTEVSPIHKYNDPGVYGVSLLVTNDFGCTSTHSEWVVIEEQTPVYVPNSFTPGGVTSKPDGLNDAFRAEFRDYELITDYSLQIFNRWGELIWESSDPEEFWRGNVRRDGYESEHFVKLDVYTWKIRYSSIAMKGTHRELTGHVTIVR